MLIFLQQDASDGLILALFLLRFLFIGLCSFGRGCFRRALRVQFLVQNDFILQDLFLSQEKFLFQDQFLLGHVFFRILLHIASQLKDIVVDHTHRVGVAGAFPQEGTRLKHGLI